MRSLVAIMQWICRNLSTGERMQHDSSTNATGSARVHALTGKEKIEVVQTQIEYLRTEVDNRISVNNTLWRAILAGLGGLILLKEQLNLDQFLFVVPALVMVLLSQWLNQMVWKDFIHGTHELVMLVEGKEEFETNGQRHRLRIGEEFLIPAGAYHTARNVGKTTSKWLYGYKQK